MMAKHADHKFIFLKCWGYSRLIVAMGGVEPPPQEFSKILFSRLLLP